jgi:hypothetical protein
MAPQARIAIGCESGLGVTGATHHDVQAYRDSVDNFVVDAIDGPAASPGRLLGHPHKVDAGCLG